MLSYNKFSPGGENYVHSTFPSGAGAVLVNFLRGRFCSGGGHVYTVTPVVIIHYRRSKVILTLCAWLLELQVYAKVYTCN